VPYAFTFLLASVGTSPFVSAVADANGYYTLNCPTGAFGWPRSKLVKSLILTRHRTLRSAPERP